MAYHVTLCEDEAGQRALMEGLLRKWSERAQVELKIACFATAEEYLAQPETDAPDILLLDIEMGAMNGVELARRVRRTHQQAQIIFVTGYSDYILDGYEVEALHYLLKPVDERKLFSVLDKAADRLRRNEKSVTLTLTDGVMRLPLHRIVWAEVVKNYVTVHTIEGTYTCRMTLVELERQLDEDFFRTGRSHIVSLPHISRVTRAEIALDTGEVIPLPRGAYEPLNRAIIRYL